ncbi:hypothetical protein C7B80_21855 [Cyanosarcina cf. burmensis CCALA 770]|nr:hypothetical protein C7B80_21855 [Cyanosarcina cf. burmensis CCALA 770]
MSLFLSTALVVALAYPDLAHRRTIADLSGKGLWQINCHCCMVNSSGEIVDLSELCNSSGNPSNRDRSNRPQQPEANPSPSRPIETKIEQSGEYMLRKRERAY